MQSSFVMLGGFFSTSRAHSMRMSRSRSTCALAYIADIRNHSSLKTIGTLANVKPLQLNVWSMHIANSSRIAQACKSVRKHVRGSQSASLETGPCRRGVADSTGCRTAHSQARGMRRRAWGSTVGRQRKYIGANVTRTRMRALAFYLSHVKGFGRMQQRDRPDTGPWYCSLAAE